MESFVPLPVKILNKMLDEYWDAMRHPNCKTFVMEQMELYEFIRSLGKAVHVGREVACPDKYEIQFEDLVLEVYNNADYSGLLVRRDLAYETKGSKKYKLEFTHPDAFVHCYIKTLPPHQYEKPRFECVVESENNDDRPENDGTDDEAFQTRMSIYGEKFRLLRGVVCVLYAGKLVAPPTYIISL